MISAPGIARRWMSRIRAVAARAGGAEVGPDCIIGDGCRIARYPGGTVSIGALCELQHGVVLHAHGGSISLARRVFLGPHVIIYGQGGVTIGDETLIAMHCRVLSSNHTLPPSGVDIRSQHDVLRPTAIGRDVWLGAGVTVLGGVDIGDAAVVAAGAVVTKSLPPGSISMGVPARVVSYRKGALAPRIEPAPFK